MSNEMLCCYAVLALTALLLVVYAVKKWRETAVENISADMMNNLFLQYQLRQTENDKDRCIKDRVLSPYRCLQIKKDADYEAINEYYKANATVDADNKA